MEILEERFGARFRGELKRPFAGDRREKKGQGLLSSILFSCAMELEEGEKPFSRNLWTKFLACLLLFSCRTLFLSWIRKNKLKRRDLV